MILSIVLVLVGLGGIGFAFLNKIYLVQHFSGYNTKEVKELQSKSAVKVIGKVKDLAKGSTTTFNLFDSYGEIPVVFQGSPDIQNRDKLEVCGWISDKNGIVVDAKEMTNASKLEEKRNIQIPGIYTYKSGSIKNNKYIIFVAPLLVGILFIIAGVITINM